MSKGDRTLGVRADTRAVAPARAEVAPAELAWLLAPPCALVLLAAIVLLGPPLGRLLFPTPDIAFWPTATPTLAIRPEPTEQARFLIALAGPVALSGLVAWLRGRALPLRAGTVALLVQASQVLLGAFVLTALIAQERHVYDESFSGGAPFRRVYFTAPTLVVAALLTLAAALALRRAPLVARIAALTRETPRRRLIAFALVGAFLGLWLLTSINTEASFNASNFGVRANASFWLDEAFAVLDQRAPLVDFHAQYGQLWPYLSAGVMAIFGASLGTYVAVMVSATALCLLAVYAVLRRLVRSSLLALALFMPFVATGFFMEIGPPANRYGPSNLFSMFPMRYGGPYVLAWLLVRHVDRLRPRRAALLFLAAGLCVLNNPDFGMPAFAATLVALVWTDARPWWPRLGALALEAAAGLLGAVVLVALLTLAVAGALPHFSYLFTFPRLWGLGGVTMLPMPALGFHLALYATFAAALVAATVRAVRGANQRTLTAMLAWSGVFGLGASSYFAGRSHPEVLISLFSAWTLALSLLGIVVVRGLARERRRPSVAEVAVLAGLALAACSLAQTPTPWSQLDRIRTAGPPNSPIQRTDALRFVAEAHARRGERVLILIPMGHRLAYELGLVNVAPYVSMISMPAVGQLGEALAALRREGGTRVFAYLGQVLPEHRQAIEAAGFRAVRVTRDYAEYDDVTRAGR
ncbi:MAG: hypothetical protein JSS99_13145 [Actinobacteria bacterium]|nr:hypothetical protein [Actinomycetota bacterium]